MNNIPMTEKLAVWFYGTHLQVKTTKDKCKWCDRENYFHGVEKPNHYNCAYCRCNNWSPK
jgi:hypothetical protein